MRFFEGRIGRIELIKLLVAYTVFITLVVYVLQALGSRTFFGPGVLLMLISLFCADAYVRRMHDLGKSGWYCLLIPAPLIGTVVFILLMALKGEDGTNQYGRPPN